ncbi:MAG: hypothetical protein WCK67_01720 [bacterium]
MITSNKVNNISYKAIQKPQITTKVQYQPLTAKETTNASLTGLGIGTVIGAGIGLLKKITHLKTFDRASSQIMEYLMTYPETVNLKGYRIDIIGEVLSKKRNVARQTFSNQILNWKVAEAAVIGGAIGTMASVLIANIKKKSKAESETAN